MAPRNYWCSASLGDLWLEIALQDSKMSRQGIEDKMVSNSDENDVSSKDKGNKVKEKQQVKKRVRI